MLDMILVNMLSFTTFTKEPINIISAGGKGRFLPNLKDLGRYQYYDFYKKLDSPNCG